MVQRFVSNIWCTRNQQRFYRVTVEWKRLVHPNIAPLLSVTTAPLRFISGWIPGGDLKEYVKNNPWTDRLRLVGDRPPTPNVTLTPPSYLILPKASTTSTPAICSMGA